MPEYLSRAIEVKDGLLVHCDSLDVSITWDTLVADLD